jgi:transcriptional regulator with XRE-family HTH domain
MDRVSKMLTLRFAKKWTLQEIGDKFGLSRERIRQLIGNTGNKKASTKPKKMTQNGTAKVGLQAEFLVSRKLIEHGIEHELMPYTAPFDIKTRGGLRLEVKTSSKRSGATNRKFNVGIDARGKYADFFMLVIKETGEIFVVPFEAVTEPQKVTFSYPETNTGMRKPHSRYLQYYNRFDLLKG